MLAHGGIARQGQTIMADKAYRSASFEEDLKAAGISLIRPATKQKHRGSHRTKYLTQPTHQRSNRPTKSLCFVHFLR